MPMFDYSCTECGHKVEDVLEKSSANPEIKECPACHKVALTRINLYASSFNYIGTGWNYSSSACNNHKV